jgi:hypothetical protein
MKTYSFIVRVTNSTIIEVNAENFEDAQEIAMNKVHDTGVLSDICNPSDMEIDLEFVYFNNNQFNVCESSAIDRMYMSDQWVQAQRDELG